jgi:molybdopterin-dependent oxidoreductase-like protein protein
LTPEKWQLEIGGLVEKPLRLDLPGLRNFPFHRIEAVHQCSGNPLEPNVPTRRVANVIWGGVRLADLLGVCQPVRGARFVWSEGTDYGNLVGQWNGAYVKDLPLEGLFVTRFYNDPVLDADDRVTDATTPVWALHPEAIIVEPAPDAHLSKDAPAVIWGLGLV